MKRKRRINYKYLAFAIILLIAIITAVVSAFMGIASLIKSDGDIDAFKNESSVLASISSEAVEPEISIDKNALPQDIFSNRRLSFAAAGDVIVHSNVYRYASQLANGTDAEYDFKPIFENVKKIISSADIAFVNQETPCAGKELGYAGYPNFNTPDEIADAITETGFDVVNIANNHMLDKGERGHKRNIDFWNSKPVTLVGGYKSKEEYNNIKVIEQNGIKIAFLAYTYSTNGIVLPSSSSYVIPYENVGEIDRQTKKARDLADIVIVSMHWGVEDQFVPNANQKRLAGIMADNCVDVIIGTHPHVLQNIEFIDRPDGKKTLVAYSLGNLISTMMYPRNMLGGIITFDIVENDNGFDIENVDLTPTMTYYKADVVAPTVYLYENFTDEMARLHGCHAFDSPNMSKSYLDSILKRYVNGKYVTNSEFDSIYNRE